MTQLALCLPTKPRAFDESALAELSKIAFYFNCYAYALNCPQIGWPAPGMLKGLDPDDPRLNEKGRVDWTIENTNSGLETDGLVQISKRDAFSDQFHTVAVLCCGRDFHFLRRDDDGLWSHKTSADNITRQDSKDKAIEEPEKANLGRYETFCGYFAIPESGVLYVPTYTLPEAFIKYFPEVRPQIYTPPGLSSGHGHPLPATP